MQLIAPPIHAAQTSTDVFRSPHSAEIYLRLATSEDDAQLTELIKEVMPSNGMLLSFERYPSYLQAIQVQSPEAQCVVIVAAEQPQRVLGMMLMVWKRCYIDQQVQQVCYLCDLRFSKALRGKKSMRLIMNYLSTQYPIDTLYQSIILTDNQLAQDIFHVERPDYFKPEIYDQVYTYSISRLKRHRAERNYRVEVLQVAQLPELKAFLQQMQRYYNFLPQDDLSGLRQQQPYWRGLRLEDFYVLRDQHDQIVGLYGLGHPKPFKQVRVLKYQPRMLLLRPFYNLYATWRGGIQLPKSQACFDYLVMHSPLCAPEQDQLFAYMLQHALTQTKRRGHRVLSLSLVEHDPRRSVLPLAQAEIIQAKHALHRFEDQPNQAFDRSKISYIDLYRI